MVILVQKKLKPKHMFIIMHIFHELVRDPSHFISNTLSALQVANTKQMARKLQHTAGLFCRTDTTCSGLGGHLLRAAWGTERTQIK